MSAVRRISRSYGFWLAFVIAAHLASLGAVAVQLLTREPAVIVESTEQALPFVAGRPFAFVDGIDSITQSFTFTEDNLARVDVRLEPALDPTPYDINVALRSAPDGPDLRNVTIDAGSIEVAQYYPVIFNVVAPSRDERFYLVISGDAPSERSAVSVWGTVCDCFREGRLVDPVMSEPAGATPDPEATVNPVGVLDVVMATYYIPAGGRAGKLQILADRMDYYKPDWLGTPALKVYAGGAVLVYAAAFWFAARLLLAGLARRGDRLLALGSIVISSTAATAYVAYFV